MEEFIFDVLTEEDLEFYVNGSNVFNLTRDDIEKDKIVLTSFSDEKLGSSEEKLDIAVYFNGKWEWVDISDKLEDYNELPVGYLISGISYTRVLVLIRRMSTVLLDHKTSGYTSYILCAVPDKYKDVCKDKALFGLLAKSQVYLDSSEEDIKVQIKEKVLDRNEEICSRLFT